jgi:cytochrome c peroxidase
VLTCALFTACGGDDEQLIDGIFTEAEWELINTLSPLPAVPPDTTNAVADDADAAALGQMFFFETSHAGPLAVGDDGSNGGLGDVDDDGLVSCASCHSSSSVWFDDDRSSPDATSLGADWGGRNAPPVVNAAFYGWFKWAGGSDTIWSQAIGTTESAKSHASTRLRVSHMIYDKYKDEYEAVFGAIDARFDSMDANAADFPAEGKPGDADFDNMAPADQVIVNTMYANFGKAIGAYERLLVSRDAGFDQYVAGDTAAISASAKRGLRLFIGKAACVECHDTPLFSDSDFHNIGVEQMGEHVSTEDLGRFTAVEKLLASTFNSDGDYSDDTNTGLLADLSQSDAQQGQFRTKHLRQIAETGPYMHTGGLATLADVIDFYDGGGGSDLFAGTKDNRIVALNLTDQEKLDLEAFLGTLTGDPIDSALHADTSKP